MFNYKCKKTLILAIILAFSLTSCGKGFLKRDKVDRNTPVSGLERAKLNIKEGRGLSLSSLRGGGKNTYEFSSSNPMWRASLEALDFLPLVTVDYSGGVIISDWYTDNENKRDSIKITLRFLSNEIQTNSIKVIVHQKKCDSNNLCSVNKLNSKIPEELKISILKKAALLEKRDKEKKK